MRPLPLLSTSHASALLVLLLLASGCQTQMGEPCAPVAFDILNEQLGAEDYARLDQAPTPNMERSASARSYLSASHCNLIISYPIPRSTQQNHVCAIPGVVSEQIIIGAHYDKTGSGKGIVDNWSGVMLNAKLVDWFSRHPPHHTFLFVMFGEEEPGMKGSEAFLAGRDITNIKLMVNIDSLGAGEVTIDRRSDDSLQCAALAVAEGTGVAARANTMGESTSDWEPFARRNIPVLNFHSLDTRSHRIVHTTRDRRSAVNDEWLAGAWRVILNTVGYLDKNLVER